MQGQDAFVKELKSRFEESVQNLDAATASRVTQARHQALEEADRAFPLGAGFWLPAGGVVATACLAVIIYALLPGGAEQQQQTAPGLEQMELISELDLYEDLEFYLWLDEHELPS